MPHLSFGSLGLQLCSGCGCPASWPRWAPAAWGEWRDAAAPVGADQCMLQPPASSGRLSANYCIC